MIPYGTFQCVICEELRNVSRRNDVFRSYFPERKIAVCDYCYEDWRDSPMYEHLRPDVPAGKRKVVEEKREYNGETHIYF